MSVVESQSEGWSPATMGPAVAYEHGQATNSPQRLEHVEMVDRTCLVSTGQPRTRDVVTGRGIDWLERQDGN